MTEHKTTVCPYCKRSYLYDTPTPKIKCCGDLLPLGFVKTRRVVKANRIDNQQFEKLSKDQWVKLYRAHWDWLHRLASQIATWTAREARTQYKRWRDNIPTAHCDCMRHWDDLERNSPPDFLSPEAFFEWSWARHNDVNRKLGKPEISLDEAKNLYNGDLSCHTPPRSQQRD